MSLVTNINFCLIKYYYLSVGPTVNIQYHYLNVQFNPVDEDKLIVQAPAQYIRYTPSQQGSAFNSGAKQRVIRMIEAQKDPIEPPKFK